MLSASPTKKHHARCATASRYYLDRKLPKDCRAVNYTPHNRCSALFEQD